MKKLIALLMSVMLAALMFVNINIPANAAGYKAQVILESYDIPESIVLGEETKITLKFKNADAFYHITNLMISANSSDNSVIPAKGNSNQFYVGTLRAGEEVSVEIPCVITYSNSGYANMSFTCEYMSDEARFTSSSYIVFPVEVEELPGVAVKSVNVPETANVSANSLVSVSFTNTTGFEMYNTQLTVDGDIRNGEVITKIGTVGINKSAYSEAYVAFANDGTKKVSLKLTYENQQGEQFEELIGDYSVNVINNQTDTNASADPAATTTNVNQMNISVLFLGAAGAILLVILIVFIVNLIRKRR